MAIIFGVGFAALNTGNNLLYLVFAMMLAFLVLSGLLSEASLRGVRIERRLPREIFAGSENRVVLRIHNAQSHAAALAITIDDRIEAPEPGAPEAFDPARPTPRSPADSPAPSDSDSGSTAADRGARASLGPTSAQVAGRCFALRIGPSESIDRSYAFIPVRRGPIEFCSLRVATRFPFGLFVKSLELELPSETLVYPHVSDLAVAAASSDPTSQDDSQQAVAAEGDAITGVREFGEGDSMARVHWRRSLRIRKLLVGEREGEAAGEVEVQLRLPPDLPARVIEERVSHAASEVVRHLEAGLRVGLRSASVRFAPATGFAHRSELLRFLALAQPGDAEVAP